MIFLRASDFMGTMQRFTDSEVISIPLPVNMRIPSETMTRQFNSILMIQQLITTEALPWPIWAGPEKRLKI